MEKRIITIGDGYDPIAHHLMNMVESAMENVLLGRDSASTWTAHTTPWPTDTKDLLQDIEAAKALIEKPPEVPFPHHIFPGGLKEDPNLTVRKQIRWPRCNKKKWRKVKKWAKNPANFTTAPDDKIYYTKDFAVAHPEIARDVKRILQNQ